MGREARTMTRLGLEQQLGAWICCRTVCTHVISSLDFDLRRKWQLLEVRVVKLGKRVDCHGMAFLYSALLI